VREMSKAFFLSIISALGALILLNLFSVIGFIILTVSGALIFMPMNERWQYQLKNELLAERVSRNVRRHQFESTLKQKGSSGV